MFTRHPILIEAAATMQAAIPPMVAFENEDEIATLPQERGTLVALPFAHAYEEVEICGPQVG